MLVHIVDELDPRVGSQFVEEIVIDGSSVLRTIPLHRSASSTPEVIA
jgi:hypothetical protein